MNEKDIARFWSHVDVRSEDECWEWNGGKSTKGYGRFSLGGRLVTASRVSFELANGPLGDAEARHTCDNPPCVNSAHLIAGTHRENMADMVRRERAPRRKLTVAQVREIRAHRADGVPVIALAAQYGVTPSNVSQIVHRRTWRHVALAAAVAVLAIAGAAVIAPVSAVATDGHEPTFRVTMTPPGVQLINGTVFADNDHINVHTTTGNYNFHFEGKCVTRTDAECAGVRHEVAQFIGADFFPLQQFVPELGCVSWVQVAGHNYHYYGTCSTPSPSPTPTPTWTGTPTPSTTPTPTPTPNGTPTPSPSTTPEPTATATPTPTSTPEPTATPTPTPTPTSSSTPTPTPSTSSTPTPSDTPSSTPTPTSSTTPGPQPSASEGVGPTPQYTEATRRGLPMTGGTFGPALMIAGVCFAAALAAKVVDRRRRKAGTR